MYSTAMDVQMGHWSNTGIAKRVLTSLYACSDTHALQQLTCTCIANGHSYSLVGDCNTECVCQQELAEVRRELQSRVDQLQGQLTYWQNTTLTVIKDHVTTGEVHVLVL